MNEPLLMLVTIITGIVLGTLFFGGLWFTVRKAMTSKIPALWVFGSVILRMGIVLMGFYWVMQRGNWLYGLICLLGFFVGRIMVIRITKAYEFRTNEELKK